MSDNRQQTKYSRIFVPPVDDFAVVQLTIPHLTKDQKLVLKDQQSILLVLNGKRNIRGQYSYYSDFPFPQMPLS